MATRTATASLNRRQRNNLLGFALLALPILSVVVLLRHSSGVQAPLELPKPIVVGEFDTISLPVPAAPVTVGTKARDIQFKFVSFPRQQVPEGAIKNLGDIVNTTAVAPLPADIPIFQTNFSSSYSVSNPVIEKITDGMRAMTIHVDATSSVEGWAGTGALVDVLLVGRERTSVVAEKVKILSAERSVSPVDGNNAPQVPSTVTILVTQEQCLAINTAIPLGKIAFALRNATDEAQWNDPTYSAERLRGGPALKEARPGINGVISVKGEKEQYVLTDGKWLKAEGVPAGFFIKNN